MGWNPLDTFNPIKQLGGILGGGGKDPGKKQLSQIMAEYAKLQNQNKVGYANALAMGQKGLKSVKEGYAGALNATQNIGASAKTSVLNREKENLGTIQGGLADSGMLGGTLGANLQRGVFSDTNTNLTQIDSALAQIRSNLMAQQGEAIAGQYGGLAALFQGQNAQQMGLGQSLIGTLGSVQHPDPNAGFNSLLGFGAKVLGHGLFG